MDAMTDGTGNAPTDGAHRIEASIWPWARRLVHMPASDMVRRVDRLIMSVRGDLGIFKLIAVYYFEDFTGSFVRRCCARVAPIIFNGVRDAVGVYA